MNTNARQPIHSGFKTWSRIDGIVLEQYLVEESWGLDAVAARSKSAFHLIRTFVLLLVWIPLFALAGLTLGADRPNILVIMVDDLGFSDLGCYGSKIETPTLDRLASDGLRFSQFYNTAKCHSSRVSLLTGQYCIAAGDTALIHGITSAEVLGDDGYFTAMTGKWHLKEEPTDFGFERFFGHLSGACNYFLGDQTFRLNGKPWKVPDGGFYTTIANVDYGLKFLEEARRLKQPWYLYVAFNAPHAPLHALPEDYARYEGRYQAGWDAVREARVKKQQQLGLLPHGSKPSPRPDHIPAWNSLSEKRREFEEKRMTTLAAMIDRVDREIGRLVDDLRRSGEFDNTLIWFVSDNGACPYDRISREIDSTPTNAEVTFGDSTGWSWVRNTPFRFYKQNQFEGGICTPAIVHWPAGLKTEPGGIHRQPAHLIDVLPTLAEVASAEIPSTYLDRELRDVSGKSLRPILEGGEIQRNEPLHFLFSADRGLREGDWKIVSFRSGPWELYNLRQDRTELTNLAEQHPDRLQKLIDRWHNMADKVLHARGAAVRPVSERKQPYFHPEWTDFSRDPDNGRKANFKEDVKRSSEGRRSGVSIRPRKNTALDFSSGQLLLTFSGDDPGIAIDQLPIDLPVGPYALKFELKGVSVGDGEVYFATDARTSLPKGSHVEFSVVHDGQWHEHSIDLETDQKLHKFRLDVSEGEGTARIRRLRLVDHAGTTLFRFPEDLTPSGRK